MLNKDKSIKIIDNKQDSQNNKQSNDIDKFNTNDKNSKNKLDKDQQRIDLLTLAMIKNNGYIDKSIKSAGINRSTYNRLLNDYPEFKEVVHTINESRIDEVENILFDMIRSKNTACVIFYLKTKAKHRGYIEKQEITNNNNNKDITVVTNDNKTTDNIYKLDAI